MNTTSKPQRPELLVAISTITIRAFGLATSSNPGSGGVQDPASRRGCCVPNVVEETVSAGRRAVTLAGCWLGKLRFRKTTEGKRHRVTAPGPRPVSKIVENRPPTLVIGR
jgi:hypothetical protein